jgi:polynucleotide 5'-hydroxyl-kinase GRC3/NOL9
VVAILYYHFKKELIVLLIKNRDIMEVNVLWEKEAKKICEHKGKIAVIGANDTGKTTVVKYLVEKCAQRGFKVGLIDADIGQSFIGPPATIGMTLIDEYNPISFEKLPTYLRFIGATSPAGHISSTIEGIKKLVDKAQDSGAEIIIIDTTGLISGTVGCELKRRKFELIKPDRIIAIQRSNELEALLTLLESHIDSEISRLPVAEAVKQKSIDYRRDYRCNKFKDYFAASELLEFYFSELDALGGWIGSGNKLSIEDLNFLSIILKSNALYGEAYNNKVNVIVEGTYSVGELFKARYYFKMKEVIVTDADFYRYILISLDDCRGESQGLALLLKHDFGQRKIILLTPVKNKDNIERITFGYLRIHPSGEEIEKITYPS